MSYANIIFSRFDFVLLQIILQEAEIMNQGKTVFAQIMSLIPRYEFDKCVKRYNGNRHAIGFKCRDQFMVMSFAQFTDQISLRSIDATLVALSSMQCSRRFGWPSATICCLPLLRKCIILIKNFIFYLLPSLKYSLRGSP